MVDNINDPREAIMAAVDEHERDSRRVRSEHARRTDRPTVPAPGPRTGALIVRMHALGLRDDLEADDPLSLAVPRALLVKLLDAYEAHRG